MLSSTDRFLISVFIPLCFENFLTILMNFVTLSFVGRYSDVLVASITPPAQIIMFTKMVFSAIAGGCVVLVSQSVGAKKTQYAYDATTVAVAVNIILGLLTSLVFVFLNKPILSIMSLEDELMKNARAFMQIVGGTLIFQSLFFGIANILRAFGHTRVSLISALSMNAVNAVGTYVVLYRPFETPLSGIPGVATATAIGQIVGFLVVVCFLIRAKIKLNPRILWPIPKDILKKMLLVSIPVSVQSLSYGSTQVITTSFISRIGALMITAKSYISQLADFVYVIGMSLGIANGLVVGRLVGAGDHKRANHFYYRVLIAAISLNVILSVLLYFFRDTLLITLFGASPEIIDVAVRVMLLDILVEIGRACNHVSQASLQATGDTRFPMVVTLTTSWIGLGFAYVFGIVLEMGLVGIWLSFAIDELLRGVINVIRWQSGKWKTKVLVSADKTSELENT